MSEVVGRYEILEQIGQGGFAVVYRAYDTELQRQVALKELRPVLLRDTGWVERFKGEARTIARLDHPYIVTIYDVVQVDPRLFIVMRLVDGPSLDKLLAAQGGLSWPQVMEIITPTAIALDYAHSQNILHRDLKPANILLDSTRGPLLSDFGLAKLVSQAGTGVTSGDAIVGTPYYIAPEVWEGQGTTPQSDIYALGCILYEMVTGDRLFQGESPPAVMMAHFSPSTLPPTWPTGVPPGITEVLETALNTQPDNRYATAKEMIEVLTGLVNDDLAKTPYVLEEVVGEATAKPPQRADVELQLPSFLKTDVAPTEVERTILVDRKGELAQLDSFLEIALAGRGQVVFVTGEAGQGKTSLLQEMVQRAQEAQPNLIVAGGICDVYTGVGDPYLPFRDVMSMLTGDVEDRWAAGIITRDHALRLWHLMPQAIQTLVEHGPDLIDTFVSGKALASRTTAYAADKPAGLQHPMRELTVRLTGFGDSQEPDQSRLFEEYTAFLAVLARQKPLLLILDDLHWADLSSISLLGHLGRRIAEHPILIVGAYRPEDVACGRENEQHPLVDILNEFKRQFGDVWVNLDQAMTTRGRAFIDAFLDTEPNRFDENFRLALARHTGGHPLFTAELLHDMQERGTVVQDEQKRWMVGFDLEWEAFPTRIEGVIEKRVSRLDGELREALIVASVEGEEFTAEVIAQVRQIEKRDLIRRLNNELGQQHRLIQEQGIQRVGSRRLSRYRFRHNLFQKYLYQSLGKVERAYLHEDVGTALEEFYSDRSEEGAAGALQLARHFQEAGLVEKAIDYLQRAGDATAQAYANSEAIAAYRQALELARQCEVNTGQLIHLYSRLGRALELNSQFDEALATYEEMDRVARQHRDRRMELAALMAQITLYATPTSLHDPVKGPALGQEALALARELGDQAAEVKTLWNLALGGMWSGRTAEGIAYAEEAVAMARQLELTELRAYALNDLGMLYATVLQLEQAKLALYEAGKLWRELDNLPMLTDNMSMACMAHVAAGEYDQAIALSDEAFRISESSNNLWGQSYSRMMVCWAYWELGQPDQAAALANESVRLGKLAGFIASQVLAGGHQAVIYGNLGAIEQGLEMACQAVTVAETQFPHFRCHPLGILAQLHLLAGNLNEAEAVIEQGREDPYADAHPTWNMRIRIAEAELALKQGDYEQTIAVTDHWLPRLRRNNLRTYLTTFLHLKGQALLAIDQTDAAQKSLLEACDIAKAIGGRATLWPTLVALSQLEPNPIEVERLHQQAREIVTYIADHAPADLRKSFLDLAEVRAVM